MHEQRLTKFATALLTRLVNLLTLALITATPLAAGCSATDSLPGGSSSPYRSGTGVGNGVQTAGPGGATAGTSGAGNYSSTGTATAGGSTGGQPAGSSQWCDVAAILQSNCQNCHNENLSYGAPMPLVTHDDLLAPAPNDGRPVYQVMLERVTATANPMPPPPSSGLSDADIATLQSWVNAGTPDGSCGTTTNGGGNTNGGTTSGSSTGVTNGGTSTSSGTTNTNGGTTNSGGTNGATNSDYPPGCIDCGDYSCGDEGYPVAFRAHNNPTPGDTEPYDASWIGSDGNLNSYECFYFEAPWGAATQLIGHRPIIDNTRVLHHWLLYASTTAPLDLTDGGHKSHCQFQPDPDRVLLAGWAPGAPGGNMPVNVGQQLPDGQRVIITLEIHYFNTDPGATALDRSGVEVCLTDTPRPEEATMHWLGTENINIPPQSQATAGDTCTPNTGQTSTILAVWPHEHLTGVHTKLELFRSDGTSEIVHDGPFSFDNQTVYWLDNPITVNPGDHLQATCTYQNNTAQSIFFGEGSQEEMCYLFTMAYPAGSLYNGRDGCLPGVGCVPGGTNRCIDNENILTAIGAL